MSNEYIFQAYRVLKELEEDLLQDENVTEANAVNVE
jgi:hypothetical protein